MEELRVLLQNKKNSIMHRLKVKDVPPFKIAKLKK
jgi:hypothetical protein